MLWVCGAAECCTVCCRGCWSVCCRAQTQSIIMPHKLWVHESAGLIVYEWILPLPCALCNTHFNAPCNTPCSTLQHCNTPSTRPATPYNTHRNTPQHWLVSRTHLHTHRVSYVTLNPLDLDHSSVFGQKSIWQCVAECIGGSVTQTHRVIFVNPDIDYSNAYGDTPMLQCVAESELQGVFHSTTISRLPNVAMCCKECVAGSVSHTHTASLVSLPI